MRPKLCDVCIHKCKQLAVAVVVSCPKYKRMEGLVEPEPVIKDGYQQLGLNF